MTLEINRDTFEVKLNNKTVNLAPKEFDILALLVDAEGKVIHRNRIIKSVWGYDADLVESRTVDQHICRLRRKTHKDLIKTVCTRGYRYTGTNA